MKKVENGNFVRVHYKGTLDNGEVFDTSREGDPLEVEVGKGQLISGFENALSGMEVEEKKTFTLKPNEAYGERDESLKRSFSRADIPQDFTPEEGMTVGLQTPDGRQCPAQIVKVDDQEVTVDLNHPLAGEALTFEVEVVGISEKPQQTPSCGPGCDCSSGCC